MVSWLPGQYGLVGAGRGLSILRLGLACYWAAGGGGEQVVWGEGQQGGRAEGPFSCVSASHMAAGNWAAGMKPIMRHLWTRSIDDLTLRAGQDCDRPGSASLQLPVLFSLFGKVRFRR